MHHSTAMSKSNDVGGFEVTCTVTFGPLPFLFSASENAKCWEINRKPTSILMTAIAFIIRFSLTVLCIQFHRNERAMQMPNHQPD